MRTTLLIIATCIAISFAADCNNPLLLQANNPLITSTDGILKTPVTAADPLKFCPRLAGKQICCDSTAQDNLLAAFKAKYQKFEKGRKEQVAAMETIENDSESNESSDAAVSAEIEEVFAEASEARILAEEVAMRALKSLRFLADKPAKGGKSATGAKKPKKATDKRTDAQIAKGSKKGRGKEQRAEDEEATKTKKLGQNQDKTKKVKATNTKLKKAQSKCFKRVFKFAAGMMCLACDADYASIVSTAADGTIQIKVKSKSCDNLMANCYDYMDAREDAGEQTKEALNARKMRKKQGSLEDLTTKLEACLDDETCSSSDKATKMQELQTKLLALSTEKATTEDKKEVEGNANMMVKKPSGCTSATNCKYICEEFVGAEGAKEEAVDLKKTSDTSGVRRLASSSVVYGDSGYEADSDLNSVGGATETYSSDASFPEEISGAGYYATSAFMLIAAMLVAFMN